MQNIFKDILKGKVVIVGIGNVMKGDDGFGPALIEKLTGRVQAVCIDAGSSPENYTGKITKEKPDTVLLVDAVHLDLTPGQYQVLKPNEILKSGFTTHDISPKMFIEYLENQLKADLSTEAKHLSDEAEHNKHSAKSDNKYLAKVDIYMLGVQPENIALGDEMSNSVKKTLDEITVLIKETINA